MNFVVGQRVIGSIARIQNLHGTVESIVAHGNQRRYRVRFADGQLIDCSSRGIVAATPEEPASLPVELPSEAPLRPDDGEIIVEHNREGNDDEMGSSDSNSNSDSESNSDREGGVRDDQM